MDSSSTATRWSFSDDAARADKTFRSRSLSFWRLLGARKRPPFDKLRVTRAAKIQVATTISTLNSFVQGVGGEYVSVKNIVPIGASPETFQPAPQDVATVADANVLVENGAGLESWLDRLLRDAGARNLRVVVCAKACR